jgi:hypothetical protein
MSSYWFCSFIFWQTGRMITFLCVVLFFCIRTLFSPLAGYRHLLVVLRQKRNPIPKAWCQTARRYNSQGHIQNVYRRFQTKWMFQIFRAVSRTVTLRNRFSGRLVNNYAPENIFRMVSSTVTLQNRFLTTVNTTAMFQNLFSGQLVEHLRFEIDFQDL